MNTSRRLPHSIVTIRLSPLGKTLRCIKGSPLIDALQGYGIEFPCGGKGSCGKCRIQVLEGEIETDSFHRARLDQLGLKGNWRLACLSTCETDLVLEVGQYTSFILADESEFQFEPQEGLGVAVDVGTTTLVCQLVDLVNGKVLAVETGLNPQSRFGSDLISRLEAGLAGKRDQMTLMIRGELDDMITRLIGSGNGQPHKVVLVGNTVMQHLFCGSDIRPLSFYPFESSDTGLKSFRSVDLGWRVPCDTVLFYPSIGSFVGSDILAGIKATRMHEQDDYSVLIDLGTNGEIVVGNRNRLECASTAAGPAFEGAKISMGMLAATGAISSIKKSNSAWECRVIGHTEPAGICGSGLIDAVAVLLENGILGEYGEILSGDKSVTIAEPVRLTQKDIQEFQLAKAAIATGLDLLLRRLSLDPADIASVYIAGAFGNYINPLNVVRTGMLEFPPDKIRQLGNTALIGAKMFLFSDPSDTEPLLERISHVNLESEPDFQDRFVDHMRFRITD